MEGEVPFRDALGVVAPLRAGGEFGGFVDAGGGVLGVFEVVHSVCSACLVLVV